MTGLWLYLSSTWKLEDVQAALNVVVSLLSALCIVVLALSQWNTGVRRLANGEPTPVRSLYTISSLGDAFEVLQLLRGKIFRVKHVPTLLQCLLVTVFTVAATLSGPIARYATNTGERVLVRESKGSLAVLAAPATEYDTVTISQTFNSLLAAGFPDDQMLDFLPDTSIPWVYKSTEWNSTWTASCVYTSPTEIKLNATGNYSLYITEPNSPTALLNEIPALQDIWPPDFRYGNSPPGVGGQIAASYVNYWPPSAAYQDELLFLASLLYSNDSDSAWTAIYPLDTWMNLSIAAVHIHGGPLPNTTADSVIGDFGTGLIKSSRYTRADCNLSRVRGDLEDLSLYQSYPNTRWVGEIVTAYTDHFAKPFVLQSTLNEDVVVPSGRALFRLFQAYIAVKDSEYGGAHVLRDLSVRVPTVELSTVFLAFVLLVTLLVALALASSLLVFLRDREIVRRTPMSKLDWMIRVMEDADAAESGTHDEARRLEDAGFQTEASRQSRLVNYERGLYRTKASESLVHGGTFTSGRVRARGGVVELLRSREMSGPGAGGGGGGGRGGAAGEGDMQFKTAPHASVTDVDGESESREGLIPPSSFPAYYHQQQQQHGAARASSLTTDGDSTIAPLPAAPYRDWLGESPALRSSGPQRQLQQQQQQQQQQQVEDWSIDLSHVR